MHWVIQVKPPLGFEARQMTFQLSYPPQNFRNVNMYKPSGIDTSINQAWGQLHRKKNYPNSVRPDLHTHTMEPRLTIIWGSNYPPHSKKKESVKTFF